MKTKKVVKKKKPAPADKRLSIPENVKLMVWNDSGGRCEFRGCNKPLWYNELTLSNSNFAELAHIIGAKQAGPRGTAESKKLQQNSDNIMLLCSIDHKEVDDSKLSHLYPAEILREMKKEHEERIKAVTEITYDRKTEILIYKCNIDTRIVDVSIEEALGTILSEKHYPKSKGILLDHTGGKGDGDKDFWDYNSKLIKQKVDDLKDKGLNNTATSHLSVFALAPIPLLIVLGQHLSDTSINKIEVFQRHRDTQDWKWKNATGSFPKYIYKKPIVVNSKNSVALVVSLSDTISADKFPEHLKQNTDVYEITIDEPNTLFLMEKSQIKEFEKMFRIALNEIQANYGKDCKVHFLPAIPAPIAVKCGMTLLPKKDSSLTIYDYNKIYGGMREVLTIG